jgi:AmiR/NasT family two-component response regulator
VAQVTDEIAELRERTRQLEHALESRIVIEQAKGMLAARHGLSIQDAFEVLRRGARSTRVRIHDLAARVVDEPETPPEITRYLH